MHAPGTARRSARGSTPRTRTRAHAISGQGDSQYNLIEIDCMPNDWMAEKKISDLKIHENTGALVIGYKDLQGKFNLNPSPEKVFHKDEILFLLGTEQQLAKFRKDYL